MAFSQYVLDVLVVRAEAEVLGIYARPDDAAYDIVDVMGGRTLAHVHVYAPPGLLERVFEGRSLVVGIDSCQLVGRQFFVRKERSVSVYGLVLEERELREHPIVSVQNGIIVHDLGKAQYAGISHERIHVVCREHAAVVIDVGSRHA